MSTFTSQKDLRIRRTSSSTSVFSTFGLQISDFIFTLLGTANAHTSIWTVLLKSCHPELGASRCAIWYAHLRAYSSSLLALSLSRLLPYTCYIVDCEPSWLFISLLYLQLVDYILYIENSYINNRCATRCASFPSNRLWAPISCYLLVVVTVAQTAVTALLINV